MSRSAEDMLNALRNARDKARQVQDAAPLLLRALEDLCESDEQDHKQGVRRYQVGSPQDKLWKNARAAIAAAKGA